MSKHSERRPRTNSSVRNAPLRQKASEWLTHFHMRARRWLKPDVSSVMRDLEFYESLMKEYGTVSWRSARIFEVGYGARPLRLLALHYLGMDAQGVDLDQPVVGPRPKAIIAALRRNGWERALKSTVRATLFDYWEQRALRRACFAMRPDSALSPIDYDRLLVCDAASDEIRTLGAGAFDFIFSEDVLEHVPPDALEQVLDNIRFLLAEGGIAFFKPHIFTGISGGHLVDWYDATPGRRRKAEPWEHLRKRRFVANTYLNELWLTDYRTMLGSRFEIVKEYPASPSLGPRYLTDDVRAELTHIPEEELLSDKYVFICRSLKN